MIILNIEIRREKIFKNLVWESADSLPKYCATQFREWADNSPNKEHSCDTWRDDTHRSPGERVTECEAQDGGGEDDQPGHQGPHPQPGQVRVRSKKGRRRVWGISSPRHKEGHHNQHLDQNRYVVSRCLENFMIFTNQFKYFEAAMKSAAETIKVATHPSVDTEYN